MALPAPILDDRKFQDIVSEARSLIPRYCPDWTDHNLSDPGITLIELFAWIVDILLYRLNRVPEKSYIKFLDLIGLRLRPALPARADITFRLSAAQPERVTIPRGTEVATVRTETQDAVTFATDRDLVIMVPRISHCLISRAATVFHDYMPVLKAREMMDVFQKVPQENDALYVGHGANLAGNTLRLTFEASMEGIGVDPRNPPLNWEFWDGEEGRWRGLKLESDTTGGLNRDGEVILRVPCTCDFTEVDGKTACWVRCRVLEVQPKQPAYTASPRVRSVVSHCIGGAVPASHAFRVSTEVLGRSNGSPGQVFHLQNTPALPRDQGETVEVEEAGGWRAWQEVEGFSSSGPDDLHFACDSVTGEVRFGPRLRQPDGGERQYGTIPPAGKLIRFSSYRCGGGLSGNVGERTLSVLKSSIPYVAWVTNFEAAAGGTESESLEHAKLRAPDLLKARFRAVTAEDFEYLACQASPEVARARCLVPKSATDRDTPSPGTVQLLIVPSTAVGDGMIPKELLLLPEHVRRKIEAHLDEHRLLTTRLVVTEPDYVWVAVETRVRPKVASGRLKAEIESRLYQFINPVSGGAENTGWPFGRDLLASEIHALIQGMPEVGYVEEVKLFSVDIDSGRRGEAASLLTISPGQLLCSHRHNVEVK